MFSSLVDSTKAYFVKLEGGRPRPLAPTCNICLIRNDNSTIWCEVTSSIRTRSANEENTNTVIGASVEKKRGFSGNNSNIGESHIEEEQIKELLLCLRPIRDGNDIKYEDNGKENDSIEENNAKKNRQSRKRCLLEDQENQKGKKSNALKKSGNEAEKSVVESLILMSSHKRPKE